jgi:DNA-binding transcriptional LysR family regulator
VQLRQLATFVAIAECGTLTAAAQQLYKTQGAVSHDLRSLERELGVLLIDRSGQRIRLTPAGAALLPHATELLQRAEDIRNEAARVGSGTAGGIRLGTPPSLSGLVLDQLLTYRKRAPDARFTFFTELQSLLVDWLLDGRLDLAVAEPELRSDLSCVVLGREDILIALHRDDPLAGAAMLAPTELGGRSFIGFIRELSSTRLAERFFTPLGEYPSPIIEVDDFRLMRRLIIGGVGFGIMPRSALDGDDQLVGVPCDPPLQRDVAILTRANRRVSPTVDGFSESLRRNWRATPARSAATGPASAPVAAQPR